MRVRHEHVLPHSYQNCDQTTMSTLPQDEQKSLKRNALLIEARGQFLKTVAIQPALLLIIAFATFSIAAFTKPEIFFQSESILYQLNELLGSECSDPSAGPVLKGFDLVSYFQSGPVIGSATISTNYKGYQFHFKSEENRSLFESNPEKYLPQYGGFCAYGAAWETVWDASTFAAPSNPEVYMIKSDGKLYFFKAEVAENLFIGNAPQSYQAGDERWASWYGSKAVYDTSCFV
mmetsp:Transcript_10881/g.16070  ORF Transcript_10881/g.16070 Transcript_10881/m.16070 type:complete len:233 (-) Transcript_10881:352-1050(-)